jgi:CRISPR/Cas system-associated exonuclease Cas4 (RecB family)
MTEKTKDEILRDMTYSFSSASSYDTCKHMFMLNYIKKEKQTQNGFAIFGSYVHSCIEGYFKGKIDGWDLAEYYKEHYDENVNVPFPAYPPGMAESYYKSGLLFFENFEFDRDNYEVLNIEEKVVHEENGVKLVVKPDLVLKDKKTGECTLVDYKTAKLKGGKKDVELLAKYKKQFLLYAKYLFQVSNIEIKYIKIWFIRDQKVVEIPIDVFEVEEVSEWFFSTIDKIKKEEEWTPNLSESNKYFCQNICGFGKTVCKYVNPDANIA